MKSNQYRGAGRIGAVSRKAAAVLAGAGIAMALPSAARADDASLTLSAGLSYSEGEYGDVEATSVIAVPVALTYREGPLKVRISVPWVAIDGPASLIATPEGRSGGGSGGGGRGGGNSGPGGGAVELEEDDDRIDDEDDAAILSDGRRSGIGDVSVSAAYSFDLGGDFQVEPGVKVKLPIASSEERLGTGEIDVTLSADLVKSIGNTSLYVHGRRKFAGRPDGSSIRSTWGAGAGASVRAGDGLYVGADYDWQESAFAGNIASSEITGWVSMGLLQRLRLTVYALAGLNSQSADIAGGGSLSYRF